MTIGMLGDVVFSVNTTKKKITAKTFKNIDWKKKYRYAVHDRYGTVGAAEFTGRDPDEMDLSIEISAFLGVNPMSMIKKIDKMAKGHKVVKLIIGSDVIGTNWVITQFQITSEMFFFDGTMLAATLQVQIKEYAGVR